MVRAARRLLLLAAGLCLAGCLSPTLPLPPPDRPSVSAPDENGLARLQGIAPAAKVEVIAWNRQTDLISGQVTGDDALYDFTIPAKVGDDIVVWYEQGDQTSQSVTVVVPSASP